MRRLIVLGVLMTVATLSLAVTTNSQQGEQILEVDQLKENLFVFRGGGGNSAALITRDGVVLVDTKLAGWGQTLIDKLNELTSNPVTTIINTHTHTDHVSGNVEFPASVDIVAHENTPAFMESWRPTAGRGRDEDGDGRDDREDVFRISGGMGLPTITFEERMTIGRGADQIDLYYFGRGHTGGDAWVVFPSLRIMHAGDMFPGKQIPLMDTNNGGSGVDYPATLSKAYSTITDIDTIITGHSTYMTRDDLREYAEFMNEFVTVVRESKESGLTVDDVSSSWEIPVRYSGYRQSTTERLRDRVQVLYDELP
jgi:glyoxylase-like metal-dependent hydrolase (beta-lactamase superfamily II)